jgi:U3 small nucleolar RNA-associated protein 22
LLSLHFGFREVAYFGNQMKLESVDFAQLICTFDELVKKLKDVPNLPLIMTNVRPASSFLRYSSVNKPFSLKNSFPIEIVLDFEKTKKITFDPQSINYMKLLLLKKIETQLKGEISDDSIQIKSGDFLFRCRIHIEYEEIILSDLEMKRELKLYRQRFIHIPLLTQFIQAWVHKYPSLSMTMRLFKKWVSSNWIYFASITESSMISEEALELLCVRVYACVDPPTSPFAGFFRVLDLLASWDWKNCPLIVELDDDVVVPEQSVCSNFCISPVVSSQHSVASEWLNSFWTLDVSILIADRLVKLSRRTLTMMRSVLRLENDINLVLTSTPEVQYDILVQLDPKKCPLICKKDSNERFKNVPTADFDPVEIYMQELMHVFRDCALFFYDKYNSTEIGVLLNPNACFQEFKVKNCSFPLICTGGEGKKMMVKADIYSIITQITLMGNGIVKQVIVMNENVGR